MASTLDYHSMLAVALAEARLGLNEGGIPIGAAIFNQAGKLIGAGHNRRVQQGDPSLHGETDAFRNAGRQKSYRKLVMVTTLAPCWYCSGLVRQFGFGTVVIGESRNFQGGIDWLRSLGVQVIDLDSQECVSLLADYIRAHPTVWNEDIGEEENFLLRALTLPRLEHREISPVDLDSERALFSVIHVSSQRLALP